MGFAPISTMVVNREGERSDLRCCMVLGVADLGWMGK